MNAPECSYLQPAVESGVYQGDCLDVLKNFPDACIDLIVTSPHTQINVLRLMAASSQMIMWSGFCLVQNSFCACSNPADRLS